MHVCMCWWSSEVICSLENNDIVFSDIVAYIPMQAFLPSSKDPSQGYIRG